MDWDLEEGDFRVIARLDAPMIPLQEVVRRNSVTPPQLLTLGEGTVKFVSSTLDFKIHPVLQMHSQLHLNS